MLSTRYSCQILTKLKFSLYIFEKKNLKYRIFMKILPVGAELLYANREAGWWTDMAKLTAAFRNVANPPDDICDST
jgi:hypothetical protein